VRIAARKGDAMPFVHSLVANTLAISISTVSIAAIMWSLERLFPIERVSVASQLRSMAYWVFAGLGTATALTVYSLLRDILRPEPLFVIPLSRLLASSWVHWSMYVIAPVLGIILYDFFGYWLHRAQHKWLWRLHAIHHSIEELSGINSYFHWTEQFFRIAFISLPAAYLVGIDAVPMVFVVELLVSLQGYYLHSPNRLHLGSILRRVIADNRFHRIHHSVEPRHFDKNFGAGTSVWDQLFGTAYFPAEDEWPATGIADRPEARSVADYLWGPFRREKTPSVALNDVEASAG
jgi:sterol desaturase/sphingolipid hydroxylase (fatty acid hydroxylase superfamily)